MGKRGGVRNAVMAPNIKWNSPHTTLTKTVLIEGDLSSTRPRLGATGEVCITLNSIDNAADVTGEMPLDIQRSRYFSTETKTCDFEIGTGATAVDRAFEKYLQNILLQEKCNLVFTVLLEERYNRKTKDDCKARSIRIDCVVHLICLLNAEPIYKWYPETKLEKAKQVYSQAVELFKEGRYLDSFHLFQSGYKLTVLGKNYSDKKSLRQKFQLLVYHNQEKTPVELMALQWCLMRHRNYV